MPDAAARAIEDAPEAIIRSQDIPRLLAALRVACEALEVIRDDDVMGYHGCKGYAGGALARITEGRTSDD